MKNKILVVALIAAVLTAGLVLAGCNKDETDGDHDCDFNAGSCAITIADWGKSAVGPCGDSSCNVAKRLKAYDDGSDKTAGDTKCDC